MTQGTQNTSRQALANTIGLAGTIAVGALAALVAVGRLEESGVFDSDEGPKTLKEQLLGAEFDPKTSVAEFLADRYMLLKQLHDSEETLDDEEVESMRIRLAQFHQMSHPLRRTKAELKLQQLLDPSVPDENIDFSKQAKKSLAGIILAGRPGFNPSEDFANIATMLRLG